MVLHMKRIFVLLSVIVVLLMIGTGFKFKNMEGLIISDSDRFKNLEKATFAG